MVGGAAAVAGTKRKLTGSEKLTELERAEGLLKRGRLTKEQFDLLVAELLPAGGEPPNATTSAAAGLLELANKKAKGAAGAEGAAAGAGGEEGQPAAEPGAAAEVPEGQVAEPGVDVGPVGEEGAVGGDEAAQADQQVSDKRRRTSYKWKYETFFDTKEKAREYIKTQPHHYVLKHGKNNDIVFQCRSHVDCQHHYRIFPFTKAKQFQVLTCGEHSEVATADSVRGVPQHYRREVDPLLRTGWTPMATLRFLESKYKDAPDLPTTESLQNRKKTLQRAREQQQPQRKEGAAKQETSMQENFEAAAEVLAGVAGASMQMGGEDMMGQDPNVHVMGMGADGGMGGVPGQDGGEHQQQWEMHQAPPPLTDGEHVGVAADASGVVADAGGVAAAGAEQGAAEGAVDMNAVGVAPAE